MQHTLTFNSGDTKYVSRPFDFETMCIINDAHNDKEKRGPLNICRDAVDYMFEGTDATQDIIDKLDAQTRTKLCISLWGFYVDALSSKNE
ncbi:MAG: hypothetical protein MR413_06570 [Clostridia bacterium]|nr:hypothetical protein [Clostridia bacterium]